MAIARACWRSWAGRWSRSAPEARYSSVTGTFEVSPRTGQSLISMILVGGIAVLVDVVGRVLVGQLGGRRTQRPRDQLLDHAAQRLVERLDHLGDLVLARAHATFDGGDADDLPVGQAHKLGDDADMRDRCAAVEIHRLEIAQVRLEDIVGAQADRFAGDGDDLVRILERIDDPRLHHQRRPVRPRRLGVIIRRGRRRRNRDAAGVEVGRRRRHLDRELPQDGRHAGLERALGRHLVEIGRLLGRLDQLASREQEGAEQRRDEASDHFGRYPFLPLNTNSAGSRSSFVAMMLRLAVSSRNSWMARLNSVRPLSVKRRTGPLLSARSLFS